MLGLDREQIKALAARAIVQVLSVVGVTCALIILMVFALTLAIAPVAFAIQAIESYWDGDVLNSYIYGGGSLLWTMLLYRILAIVVERRPKGEA